MADPDAPETKPQPPPMIGSYRLVEPLGSGGMSSVFLARHAETDHEVAVKVLPRYLAKNSTLLQRFIREARSAESLEHPNIVGIYDRGSEAGRYYLVLEYVPGGDLHDRVREKGPLGLVESVDVMIQIANGLSHAAGRGLIHRDIKPANLLMTPDGKVKITDLGLALHIEEEDERVTRDGTTVGTVDYMAPEQARDSRAASVRSDMYSLGCTLYFLLTGQAPFGGGDVAEKLRSHAIEPPPDVRGLRPEVPEAYALLIQKMMAKRPEKRYANYAKLIEALEAVGANLRGEPPPTKPEPLYALIDDDDDDLPAPAEESSGPLYALIDDDDAEEGFTLGPSKTNSPAGSTLPSYPAAFWPDGEVSPTQRDESSLADVNFAGLAGVEEASPRIPELPRRSGSRPSLVTPADTEVAGPVDPYGLEEPLATDQELVFEPPLAPGVPLSTWVFRFAVLGLFAAIAVAVWTWVGPTYFEDNVTPPPVQIGDDDDGRLDKKTGMIRPWSEPADQVAAAPTDLPPPTEVLSKIGMAGAEEELAPRAEAPFVEVRRVDPQRDRDHVGDLRRAFDTLGGTIDISDDGPFFEQDFRISGTNRVMRARAGFRPIVVLETPSRDSVKGSVAVVDLGEKRTLFLEGIDFVIRGADIGPKQTALFLCRGSELTLRDCTITLVGPLPHPFAIVQMGEPGAHPSIPESRVRIERTLIRGAASDAIRLCDGGELLIARSAIFAGTGKAIAISGGAAEKRRISFFRSTIAASGPIFELSGAAASVDATPAKIESIQTTFARIASASSPATLIALRDVPAGGVRKRPLIDWSGEENAFIGWREWTASSPPGVLAGLRGMSPASDKTSIDEAQPWSASMADPWAVHGNSVTPHMTAVPSAHLREKSLESFGRTQRVNPPAAATTASVRFDAGDPANARDLGKFIAESMNTQASKLRVTVVGNGMRAMTPVEMPEGISLELNFETTGDLPLSLVATENSVGDALFAVHHADLTITGAHLRQDAHSPGLKSTVAVDQGVLILDHCVLTAPKEAEVGNGSLVRYRTEGTRPLASSGTAYPFCRLSDCVLISGANALSFEVGRGVIDLSNCAIAAGGTAIALKPEKVRRDRFAADLRLDRCTIAAEETLVSVAAWPGLPPGPDRPWVISSRASVFLDTYDWAERRLPQFCCDLIRPGFRKAF